MFGFDGAPASGSAARDPRKARRLRDTWILPLLASFHAVVLVEFVDGASDSL